MGNRLDLAGRRAIAALTSFFLPKSHEITYSWTEVPPERVLLIRHDDRIGNLILMMPLLNGVRQTWPDAEIGILIGPKYAQIYQEEEEVDRLWILEKKHIIRNPLLFLGLIRSLRRFRYDIAFDCSHMHSFSLTGAAITRLSNAQVRVAYDRGRAEDFCNLLVEPLRAEHHESDALLNLLRPFVDELPDAAMTLHLSKEENKWAEGLRSECIGEGEGLFVGIHVGGRGVKKWPIERYLSLVENILSLFKATVIVFCGPGEKAEAEQFRMAASDRTRIFDRLGLREMMALVAQCDFFISPDTGPMHVAVAFEVPTVAIFLEELHERYGPRGPDHRVVHVVPDCGEKEVLAAFGELVSSRFHSNNGNRMQLDRGETDANPQ